MRGSGTLNEYFWGDQVFVTISETDEERNVMNRGMDAGFLNGYCQSADIVYFYSL